MLNVSINCVQKKVIHVWSPVFVHFNMAKYVLNYKTKACYYNDSAIQSILRLINNCICSRPICEMILILQYMLSKLMTKFNCSYIQVCPQP